MKNIRFKKCNFFFTIILINEGNTIMKSFLVTSSDKYPGRKYSK